MNKHKTIAGLLTLTMIFLAFTGCATNKNEEASFFSVTDMTGREINFDGAVDQIVALTASDCEILYALGAGDTLVGRGAYCDYPAEVLDVPTVDSGANTNIEEIIALKPQVVLMATMSQTKEQVEMLEAAGIKCVVSNAQDIAGVYDAIELIGSLVKKDANAAKIISDMKSSFAAIQNKSTGTEQKTVYFEVSPLEQGLWTAGNGTFMDEMATMLGLTNAFSGITGWSEISEEQVIECDPDYIVTITMYFGEGLTPVEEIRSRAGWQNITAIKNDAIFNANFDEISRPGPRLADAAQELYDFFYTATAMGSAA